MSDPTPPDAPETDRLLEHDADGIREYDNPTPGWWTWIFVASVIFAVVYFVFFQLGQQGWTVHQAYEAAVKANEEQVRKAIGDLQPDVATLLRVAQEERLRGLGQQLFAGNCAVCHGPEGAGLVGPNLTDDHYKNLKQLDELPKVVAEGAANGAMPAWKTRLSQTEIVLVAGFAAGLRGKHLSGPRPAEGELIPPWPAAPAAAPGGVPGAPPTAPAPAPR